MNYLSKYLEFLYLLTYIFLLLVLETSIRKTQVLNRSVEQCITLSKKIVHKG